jgi:hypothetical protein
MTKVRVGYALFAAYLIATCVHIGWVVAHEPFSFDAWNVALDTGAKPGNLSRFFDYWAYEYTHSNPRLGQPLTYLVYKFDYLAEVLTPLAFVAISAAITTLGLGRLPRKGRDLALWAIALGCSWFALPEIGRNMFCRAYATNYVYTIAAVLWFLVPVRLGIGKRPALYAVCGLLVGMCNEHTGPALVLLLGGYAWWLRRRGEPFAYPLAGAIGVALGFAALFFAPGQDERYGGLAEQVSLPMRLIQRGVVGNLDIVRDWIVYAAPLLVIVAILVLARTDEEKRARALRGIAVACATGLVITMTLFVSPKLGSRFYMVPMALLLAGVIGLADVVLERRALCGLVAVAVAASIYAGVRTVPLYAKVAAQAAERMTALEATPPGDVFIADAWEQVEESWWFIGDDFRDVQKCDMVARYFGFTRVYFRGYERLAPLGLGGARFVARYSTADGKTGIDPTFEVGVTKNFDLEAVHAGTLSALEVLRRRIAPAQVDRFELDVEFVGAPPPLPRSKIVVSRWQDGHLEDHIAKLKRSMRARTVELGKGLAGFDVYVVRIGEAPKKLDASREYTPWRGGVYWILACDANECWVIAATRQGGG